MKRHRGLFEHICAFDNLLLAARKAQRGKRFTPPAAVFNHRLESELLRLQQEMLNETYRPGPYTEFHIQDPKSRLISAAPYRDRVVHHALCNIVEPAFDRTFIFDSYACRVGKGTHAAVDRLTRFLQVSRYVLKCDLSKYFPSIDHAILKGLIRRKIGCARTLRLIDLIIDQSNPQEPVTHYFPGDDLFTPWERRRGIPIGNQTSQFFANIYLNPLDYLVKEELGCRRYIRYVDDFVVLDEDKGRLWAIRAAIEQFLANRLRLMLHPVKRWVQPVTCGVDFLGYRVFPTHRLLLRESGYRFQRRLRRMQDEYRRGMMSAEDVHQRIAAWLGHAGHADTHGLRTALLGGVVFSRESVCEAACCAAGAGTIPIQTTSARPTVTTTTRRIGTTTTGFVVR